jgi:hypothetical protein
VVFGILLIAAAVAEFTGWIEKRHWGRAAAWAAGGLSGALGGLVGNQGGIRTAAMLEFGFRRAIATLLLVLGVYMLILGDG